MLKIGKCYHIAIGHWYCYGSVEDGMECGTAYSHNLSDAVYTLYYWKKRGRLAQILRRHTNFLVLEEVPSFYYSNYRVIGDYIGWIRVSHTLDSSTFESC